MEAGKQEKNSPVRTPGGASPVVRPSAPPLRLLIGCELQRQDSLLGDLVQRAPLAESRLTTPLASLKLFSDINLKNIHLLRFSNGGHLLAAAQEGS